MIVPNMPPRFAALMAATEELMVSMHREQRIAVDYFEKGQPYIDAANAGQRLREVTYRAEVCFGFVEVGYWKIGTALVDFFDAARRVTEALENLYALGGVLPHPAENLRFSYSDIVGALTPASASAYDQSRRQIQAEIYRAAAAYEPVTTATEPFVSVNSLLKLQGQAEAYESTIDESAFLQDSGERDGCEFRTDKSEETREIGRMSVSNGVCDGFAGEVTDTWRFVPNGDGYDIAGLGEQGHFKRLTGFECVEKLLRKPGKPVTMMELVADRGSSPARVQAVPGTPTSRECFQGLHNGVSVGTQVLGKETDQPVIDEEALNAFSARLQEIDEDSEQAKEWNDFGRVEKLAGEREEVVSQMQDNIGLAGRVRNLNSKIDGLRSTIAKRLATAWKKLRAARPPLGKVAQHLEGAISASGDSYIYNPQPVPPWLLG